MAGSEPSTLYHLLQEQQEPFILQIYLSERGCPEKRLNSPHSFSCYHWISRKSVKRSVRCMLNRSKEDIPWCLKMITAVYNQLIPLKARPKTKKINHKERRCITKQNSTPDLVEEYGGFSTVSSTIMESYYIQHGVKNATALLQQDPGSFTASNHQPTGLRSRREKEVSPDKELKFHCSENDKQLSPVSVLEDTSSIGSPTPGTENFPKRTETPKDVAESYILCSSSIWELLFHSGFTSSVGAKLTEIQDSVHSGYQSQDGIPKTGWHKLMLDLVKEVVQTQSRSRMQKHHQGGYLESEELGKIIAEKMKSWTKQFGDASNSIRFEDSDFRHPGEECRSYEQEKKEVGLEVVDAILEEINAEFITEMTGFCHEQAVSNF